MNELSIIVPCVSTIDTIFSFIDEIAVYLMENPSDVDCIVVTNGQTEKSNDVVAYVRGKYPWLKFILLQRAGKVRSFGALARFGVAYSTSHYAAFVSPYGEDDLSIIPGMLKKIRAGAQVVQATRYSSHDDVKKVPLKFRLYQYIYRSLTRLLLGVTISDATYGFKMFDRPFIQALGLTHNGYSVCPEIVFKGLLAGGKVEYFASAVRPVPPHRDFKLYKEGLGYLWLLLRGLGHRIGILWF